MSNDPWTRARCEALLDCVRPEHSPLSQELASALRSLLAARGESDEAASEKLYRELERGFVAGRNDGPALLAAALAAARADERSKFVAECDEYVRACPASPPDPKFTAGCRAAASYLAARVRAGAR